MKIFARPDATAWREDDGLIQSDLACNARDHLRAGFTRIPRRFCRGIARYKAGRKAAREVVWAVNLRGRSSRFEKKEFNPISSPSLCSVERAVGTFDQILDRQALTDDAA